MKLLFVKNYKGWLYINCVIGTICIFLSRAVPEERIGEMWGWSLAGLFLLFINPRIMSYIAEIFLENMSESDLRELEKIEEEHPNASIRK